MGKNKYVGHRYVPKVDGEWDKSKSYESLTIVLYQGASYTSRQNVPIGVEITNDEFWVLSGNYNGQLAQKVGNGIKAELEDLSTSVLSAIEGGEGTSFNLLSIPQDESVSWKKTTFMQAGENLFDDSKVTTGTLHYDGTVIDSQNRIVTDYIPITTGDSIYFTYEYASQGAVQFDNVIYLYDKYFTYLERLLEYKSGETILNPEVKFIRTTTAVGVASNRLTISKKPLTEYVPYYITMENVKLNKENIVGFQKTIDDALANVNIKTESNLSGKTLVCFGDSITGNYFEDDYPSVIANRTGMNVFNVGFGGSRLGRHWGEFDKFSFYNLVDNVIANDFENLKTPFEGRPAQYDERVSILETIDFNTVDYISIAYGANDWGDNSPNEKTDIEDPTSFIGAGRLGLRKLLEEFPHLRILVISPFYRYFPTDNPMTDSDEKDISGMYLYEYVDSAKQLAEEFKTPFLNAYHNLGINKYTRGVYFDGNDGTHPNPKGRKLIGETVASKMISMW